MKHITMCSLKAFNTALPTGVRQVKKMRSFYTSSLVALQPFFAPEVTEPGGIFYGINNTTKNLVFANRKSLTSPQGIIIGPTGSRKEFSHQGNRNNPDTSIHR